MGKLLIFRSFIVLAFSTDIFENRRHVHIITKAGKQKICKFWIEKNGKPEISLADNKGFSVKEINKIQQLLEQHSRYINEQMENFYAGRKIITKKIEE